jgi:hypothetical protein
MAHERGFYAVERQSWVAGIEEHIMRDGLHLALFANVLAAHHVFAAALAKQFRRCRL